MPGLTPKSEPFFRHFVNNANKLSPHPLDWDRWYDFASVWHYLRVKLSGEEVAQLLVEEAFLKRTLNEFRISTLLVGDYCSAPQDFGFCIAIGEWSKINEQNHRHRQPGPRPGDEVHPRRQPTSSFSVASNHSYTTSGSERRQETEWFNCQAFGKLAKTCNQYLTMGQQVYLEGRLKSRTYQTQSGEARFSKDINVTDIQFLSRRSDSDTGGIEDDDGPELPF